MLFVGGDVDFYRHVYNNSPNFVGAVIRWVCRGVHGSKHVPKIGVEGRTLKKVSWDSRPIERHKRKQRKSNVACPPNSGILCPRRPQSSCERHCRQKGSHDNAGRVKRRRIGDHLVAYKLFGTDA